MMTALESFLATLSSRKRANVEKVFRAVVANGSRSIAAIAEEVDLDVTAAARHIRTLREAGFVRREGETKNGKWIAVSHSHTPAEQE